MHKQNNLSVELMVTRRPSEASAAQRVYALEDTDVVLPGIKARLGKGARLIHPSEFNGSDVHIILSGNAHIEVLDGYRLIGACNGLVTLTTAASFSVIRGKEVVEVTVFTNEVMILADDRQHIVHAFRRATYNVSTRQIVITDITRDDAVLYSVSEN